MEKLESHIPVTLLTGFLGSGKTTLLNHLVSTPKFKNSLIIINEFGEIALDHLLVSQVKEADQVIEISNGCVCCTMQGDLYNTLKDVYWRFSRQGKKVFDKLIIETTGLADPTPILHTLLTNEWLFDHYRLDGILTTVDAVNAEDTLNQYPEAVKQVAMADGLIINKVDLAKPSACQSLSERLQTINPQAKIWTNKEARDNPDTLANMGLYNTETKKLDVLSWLNMTALKPNFQRLTVKQIGFSSQPLAVPMIQNPNNQSRHNDKIKAHCFSFDVPFSPTFFDEWLSALLGMTGSNVLRIKGIISVQGQDKPMVIHGVQHIFHPAVQLEQWPSEDRQSHVVFITRDIEREFFERTFKQI
jgi:G3E family GTPase